MGIVLADDLTSATEAAGHLAAIGRPASVVLDTDSAADCVDSDDTICLDLDSRSTDPHDAAARHADAVRRLLTCRNSSGEALYKSMDSSLRGNWAVELAATMRAAGSRRVAVLAPAYPAYGRTTVGGEQYAEGVRVDLGPAGTDPTCAVADASLVRPLAAAGFDVHVTRPDRELENIITRLLDHREGSVAPSVVVVDAATTQDLELVALTTSPRADELVLCGSPGLWEALNVAAAPPAIGIGWEFTLPKTTAVLVLVGSLHPTTRAQLACLGESGIPTTVLTAASSVDAILDHLDHLRDGDVPWQRRAVVLATPEQITQGQDTALAHLTRTALACCTRRPDLSLIVSGGDTARAVALALGARSITALGMLAPGIPVGRLRGPHPCHVISKAGGFGGPDALAAGVRALLGRSA
jgi:uncharacterized protein YgbK (DUF1537 family)